MQKYTNGILHMHINTLLHGLHSHYASSGQTFYSLIQKLKQRKTEGKALQLNKLLFWQVIHFPKNTGVVSQQTHLCIHTISTPQQEGKE